VARVWYKDIIYVVKFCLQQVYFGASVTKFYLAFDMLGISCFTGMSYLVRRTHLDDVKGLSYFGRFLAEDFFLAKYLHERQAYLFCIITSWLCWAVWKMWHCVLWSVIYLASVTLPYPAASRLLQCFIFSLLSLSNTVDSTSHFLSMMNNKNSNKIYKVKVHEWKLNNMLQ